MSDGLWGKLKGLFQPDETPANDEPKIVIPKVVIERKKGGVETAVSQPPTSVIDPIFLRQQMSNHLDDAQLVRLGQLVGIDYAALPGGKGGKVLALVTTFEKEGKLDQLLQKCRAENSNIAWQLETKDE